MESSHSECTHRIIKGIYSGHRVRARCSKNVTGDSPFALSPVARFLQHPFHLPSNLSSDLHPDISINILARRESSHLASSGFLRIIPFLRIGRGEEAEREREGGRAKVHLVYTAASRSAASRRGGKGGLIINSRLRCKQTII